jgi:signal peptidase I
LAEAWDWMKSVVIALLVVVLVHQYGFHLSTVKGASMQPTLEDGEWLFINKTIRFTGPPRRGDVIVVKEPEGIETEHPYLVKRVVAIAGDELVIRQGKLLVNGIEQKENYTDSPIEDGRFEPYTVQQGSLFVMGDNRHRHASYDSRSFGAISLDQVEGRAEWIIWPFIKIRAL